MVEADGDKMQGVGGVALAWWGGMQDRREDGTANPVADRGGLAAMRHADASTIMMCEPVHRLYHRVQAFQAVKGFDPGLFAQVTRVARVLAHVDRHVGRDGETRIGFGRQIGAKSGADRPVLSRERFGELITARDDDELVSCMRRAVDVAKNSVNVADLAEILFYWGDKLKASLAYKYYGGS